MKSSMENCCRWKKSALGQETATMLFLPVKQNRNPTFVQGFGPHPNITLGEGRLLQRAGMLDQSWSATTTTGLVVEGVKRLEIYLNYTRPTSKTATINYPPRRVSKVCENRDRLACQDLETRSNPERKPTSDFYNYASDCRGNETEVESDTKGAEKYEKHTETQTTAIMSSEKAGNPKDKLEGTYPSIVWGLPPFYASIYLTVMLILS